MTTLADYFFFKPSRDIVILFLHLILNDTVCKLSFMVQGTRFADTGIRTKIYPGCGDTVSIELYNNSSTESRKDKIDNLHQQF